MTLAIRIDRKRGRLLVPVSEERAANELARVQARNPEAKLIRVLVKGWG